MVAKEVRSLYALVSVSVIFWSNRSFVVFMVF